MLCFTPTETKNGVICVFIMWLVNGLQPPSNRSIDSSQSQNGSFLSLGLYFSLIGCVMDSCAGVALPPQSIHHLKHLRRGRRRSSALVAHTEVLPSQMGSHEAHRHISHHANALCHFHISASINPNTGNTTSTSCSKPLEFAFLPLLLLSFSSFTFYFDMICKSL